MLYLERNGQREYFPAEGMTISSEQGWIKIKLIQYQMEGTMPKDVRVIRSYVGVSFFGDAPTKHPAFERAKKVGGVMWVLPFPIRNPSILRNKKAQMEWAQTKLKYLREWGIQGQIIQCGEIDKA